MNLLPFFLAAALSSAPTRRAMILKNARVVFRAQESSRAATLVVENAKIAYAGDEPGARSRFPAAEELDLSGRVIYPGFFDSHGHLWELGEFLETADLKDARSPEECVRRLSESAARLPGDSWLKGYGWDQNLWEKKSFPSAALLDRAFPKRPVLAKRIDGHAIWINSEAMRRAGISRGTSDPKGGKIVRDASGAPTGVLLDNAADLVTRAEPPASRFDLERRFRLAFEACAAAGLTGVGDASGDSPGYDQSVLPVLRAMAERGEVPIRIYATVGGRDPGLDAILGEGPVERGNITIRAVKLYADGALGSRGAALLADYSDDAGNRGFYLTEPPLLEEIVEKCFRAGFQVWIHAIGDRANRAALDAIAKAAGRAHPPDARPRIEHAQVVAPEDRGRFALLGVIASIQPSFATSDMAWAASRLSPARLGESYAWKSLAKSGARLCGGSDTPWESYKPLSGIYAAVSRKDLRGKPEGGWRPEEDLSLSEAIGLYTSDAAYATFAEQRRGAIAPGFDADLTVLDRDLSNVSAGEISNAQVVLTMVAGKIVFRKP
jgi:hypothetical protein